MKITRMGHAALLVESDSDRILIDPGTFTDSWHDLEGLTAILITHQHHDHVDSENVAHLAGANPGVTVAVEEAVAPMLLAVSLTLSAACERVAVTPLPLLMCPPHGRRIGLRVTR